MRRVGVGACAALVGCGSDPTRPVGDIDAELRILGGATAADTIESSIAEPIVVELREVNGGALAGVAVRFEVISPASSPSAPAASVRLSTLAGQPLRTVSVDTTDRQGRAQASVVFGSLAGPSVVRITAPTLGAVATATFDVRPGALHSVSITPADTALYAGSTYQLSTVVTDRRGNVHPAVPVITSSGHVVVGIDQRVLALETGRASVIASASGWADTAFVSILPRATIVARMTPGTATRTALVTVNLDGTERRTIATRDKESSEGFQPAWAPAGDRVVVIQAGTGHLRIVDTEGTERPLNPPPSPVSSISWPKYTRDGEWIYFAGQPIPFSVHALWRMRADGSGVEQLVPYGPYLTFASPSPDGRRLAFTQRTSETSIVPALRILDIETRQVTDLGIANVWAAQWSPVDDRIAWLEFDATQQGSPRRLHVVQADGSGDRVIAQGNVDFALDWSPDGQWLLVRHDGTLAVIDADTGEVMPIPYFTKLSEAAWRP